MEAKAGKKLLAQEMKELFLAKSTSFRGSYRADDLIFLQGMERAQAQITSQVLTRKFQINWLKIPLQRLKLQLSLGLLSWAQVAPSWACVSLVTNPSGGCRKNLFNVYLFIFERERERERERTSESARRRSRAQGSIPWTMRSWPKLKSRVRRSTNWATQVSLEETSLRWWNW